MRDVAWHIYTSSGRASPFLSHPSAVVSSGKRRIRGRKQQGYSEPIMESLLKFCELLSKLPIGRHIGEYCGGS